MATVGTELSMSLDGFITDPAGGVDHIFDWYADGTDDTRWTRRCSW
jgi:hypothetical protein